ncbi:MAG: lysine--tRNA ligase [Sutterellaceae bacterium]|nr:lysine--tRNA ligase [Sutterellaceae bacterium]MDY2867812.1 lysine--tRNA ligase [Mesosutterella sp.]
MTEQKDKAAAAPAAEDENHIIAERRAKLQALRDSGVAYPNDFRRKDYFGDLRATYGEKTREELEAGERVEVQAAGRIMLKRVMGKVMFLTVRDMTGSIQFFVQRDALGEEKYKAVKTWDVGDIVGTTGYLFKTRTGELSIHVEALRLLTKSIRPLPDKHKGITDPELIYRQRYVDLMTNEASRNRFVTRSKVLAAIREFMAKNRFMEVETPMLHPIPGGANAKPFITHHNALDEDLYLRIAPELYLKRLVVGGFERVYDMNRCFRNEGMDVRHNPEFTTIEWYATYWDYKIQMDFTEELIRYAAIKATGSAVVQYQGTTVDLSKPFDRLTPKQAIMKYSDYTSEQLDDEAFMRSELARRGEPQKDFVGKGTLLMAMFDLVAEEKLIRPTFLIDFPTEVSPLARASDSDPSVCERFELYIVGREHANGFSELNDPDDQAHRFKAQADAKSKGDDEAMYYDADYIRALEYGLAPTSGCGIGIDRLVMLLTDAPSIRDVLLFPQMRRETGLSIK